MPTAEYLQVDVLERMLDASELLYYAEKFKGKKILIAVKDIAGLRAILPDLKVAQAARIQILLFVPAHSEIREEFLLLNQFKKIFWESHSIEEATIPLDSNTKFSSSKISIIYSNEENLRLAESAIHTAIAAKCLKCIISGLFAPIKNDQHVLAQISYETAATMLSPELPTQILEQAKQANLDLVSLEDEPGAVFTELFTHWGSGTLIAPNPHIVYRKANVTDGLDLFYLLQPAIKNGLILPVSEKKLLEDIKKFQVCTMDNEIVAAAKYTDYGEAAEIGKIVTMPRFRGQGTAKQLIRNVIEELRKQDKKYVFALTINQTMAEIFKSLGFQDFPREGLPESWKNSYDFTRPSRAYRFLFAP